MTIAPISWPLLIGTAALVVLLMLVWYGWDRLRAWQRRRTARRHIAALLAAGLPPDTEPLVLPGSSLTATTLSPAIFFIAVGTYGLNRTLASLKLLATAGLDPLVGVVLAVETDTVVRAAFAAALPVVYRDRVVYGAVEDYTGFANRPIAQSLDQADEWAAPIARATEEAIDRYLRRSLSQAPALVWLDLSLGGQLPTGLVVLAALADRFERGTTLFAASTGLPRHRRLRDRWRAVKPRCDRYLAGWLLIDNLGADPTTSDSALALLIAGQLAAGLTEERPTALINLLALALSEQPGGVLILQSIDRTLPAFAFQPDPIQPPIYYVHRRPLVVQVQRTLRALDVGRGVWSADLPVAEADTSLFDLILVPLTPAALQAVRDDVAAGHEVRQVLLGDGAATALAALPVRQPDRDLAFGSLPAVIDPQRPLCRVIGLRITAVRDGAALVAEIVKPPAQRRWHGTRMPRPAPRVSTHGHQERRVRNARTDASR
ncbi:MAG: hypothetical protein AB7R89_03490 [Dehalococcoidia bacterium]